MAIAQQQAKIDYTNKKLALLAAQKETIEKRSFNENEGPQRQNNDGLEREKRFQSELEGRARKWQQE